MRKLTQFKRTYTQEDQQLMQEHLRALGIDPNNVYQELEMSSRFVNTHRDTTYSNGAVSLHSHDYYEVLFCRSSSGVEYLVGSDRYRLQEGDIVFVPPGVSHRPILPEKMNEPYVRDVLWISREFADSIDRMFPDPTLIDRDHSPPVRTAGTRWEFLGDLFHNGVREEEARNPGWEIAVIGNTLTIVANLKRAYIERSTGTMKAEKPELLDKVTDYIENHYAEHITVRDLSRKFYVSDSSISHLFKQKMGVSIYHYVTQRRLISSKTLILEGLPLEQVATRVGFSDYSTFYRAFKQEYGISPRQYKNL